MGFGRSKAPHERRRLVFESLESRSLLAATTLVANGDWHNPVVWSAGVPTRALDEVIPHGLVSAFYRDGTGDIFSKAVVPTGQTELTAPMTRGDAPTNVEPSHAFGALQDAFLENAARVNGAVLRAATGASERTSYILFDVTGLEGRRVQSARLRVRVTEAGSGTLQVLQGAPILWTERFLSPANAPAVQGLLDSATGSFAVGDWLEFDVTDGVLGEGYTNFILSIGSEGGSVGVSAREGLEAPQLLLTTADPIAADADGDSDVDGQDFLTWQRTLGTTVQPGAGADGNANGVVDAFDLNVWRSQYGPNAQPVPPNSVTLFGATANDFSVDQAAIQAALSAHSEIYFPPGEYWIDAKIVIPAGRTLRGPASGAPAIIRVRHDTGNNASNYALEIAGDDVSIENLVIDKDFVDGSYGIGILAHGRRNITISGVEIRNYSVRYGVHLIECQDFEISSCYVHSFMMNQSTPGGFSADMIRDSPAGVRITRSVRGLIRDSRIHNIEVGALGRATISELVPSYGPQGYQSDCITLSDCSEIVVENNNLWNSGELVDILVSDKCTVRNNTLQMAYLFAVKCIGSQDSTVTGNYLADAAVGIILVDHESTGEQCTGNFVDRNEIVNCGSRGIWNIAANHRLGLAISGFYIDNNATGNTVTNNNIYNFHGYLSTYLRQGTGGNTVVNNDGIAGEFGPAGGGDAAILGQWTAGLHHAKEHVAVNRALVFFTHAVDASETISAAVVTYGGRAMTKLTDRLEIVGARRVYVSAWILTQDGINVASSGDFAVTWTGTPDQAAYSSVFLENIYQKTPLFSHDTAAAATGNTLATSPRPTHAGDIILYGATALAAGGFTPAMGYSEALELDLPTGDATAGYKVAAGANEAVSVTHTDLSGGVIYMSCLQKNPSVLLGSGTVDITTLGALPNDGVNDAVIIQNALNNPAYDEIYLPTGVYHFDRSLFVPSYKTIRGDSYLNTEIRTLADITPFRIDGQTGATISDLSVTRPQTANSNNEIVRVDNSTLVLVDQIRAVGAASRAPIINFEGGNRCTVSRCIVQDYQVIRNEGSAEKPGLHTQVYGSGITLTRNSNFSVLDCEVIQTIPPIVESPTVKGWHQSSAIQAPVCDTGRLSRNYIYNTGQGIDTSGAAELSISHNVIEQIHSAGIKLVNGSNHIIVEKNYLRACGLTGIWVSVGVAGNGGSYENTIRYNVLVSMGKGFGLDFWDYSFTASAPAAIHIQAAQLEQDRVRSNVIAHNRSYDNSEQLGTVVIEGAAPGSLYPGINNLIQANTAEAGPAPAAPFGPTSTVAFQFTIADL